MYKCFFIGPTDNRGRDLLHQVHHMLVIGVYVPDLPLAAHICYLHVRKIILPIFSLLITLPVQNLYLLPTPNLYTDHLCP